MDTKPLTGFKFGHKYLAFGEVVNPPKDLSPPGKGPEPVQNPNLLPLFGGYTLICIQNAKCDMNFKNF